MSLVSKKKNSQKKKKKNQRWRTYTRHGLFEEIFIATIITSSYRDF